MRGTPAMIIVSILLAVLTIPVLAKEMVETVTITLTNSQAKTVQDAKGRNVVVELTDEQIKAISEGFKGFDLKAEPPTWKTLTLNTAQVHRGNTVFLELLVTEGMDDPRELLFEANPQPSP